MRLIDADELRKFIKSQYFKCDMPEEWGNGVMWATSQINHYCNKADAPTIETKQIKYFDEDEKVWKIGNVIVEQKEQPQAEMPEYAEWKEPFEKMTDCP